MHRVVRRSGGVAGPLALVAILAGCTSNPPDGRFACADAADCPTDWVCECNRCYAAAGSGCATDAGTSDAGCTGDGDCDDGIPCTVDTCDGTCQHAPMDALCAGPACATGRCDELVGCVLVLDDAACDDSDPCTTDVCDSTAGCRSTPAPDGTYCDDGLFCNGVDSCEAGRCDVHAGDPCGAPTSCDPSTSACVGCTTDGDCPGPATGPWGACVYEGHPDCDESGTETRTITTYRCSVSTGECVASATDEMRPCSRATESMRCEGRAERICCTGQCVDFTMDDENCGGCGIRCRDGGRCEDRTVGGNRTGMCGCPSGVARCPSDDYTCADWLGTMFCQCNVDADCGPSASCNTSFSAVQFCEPD